MRRTKRSGEDGGFASLVAVAALPYAAVAGAGCGLIWHLSAGVADGGLASLNGVSLLPAAAVVAVLAAGAGAGIWSLVVQLRTNARLARLVHAASVPCPDDRERPGVVVVEGDERFAFAYGLRAPRVVVSRGLLAQLSPAEVDAVVAHERYHQRNRDPLKLLVARVAGAACFFLPAVRHLTARHLARSELAADRAAVRARGCAALAGALCKTVPGPGWDALRAATPIASPELLALRVEQLERGAEPPLPRLPARALSVSVAVFASLTGAVVAVSVRAGVLLCMRGTATRPPVDLALGMASAVACAALWVWLALVATRALTAHATTAPDL